MLEQALAGFEGNAFAAYLRGARWSYAAVSALHIFGIAALVGAVIPLNLKLLGTKEDSDISDSLVGPITGTGFSLAKTLVRGVIPSSKN